MPMVDPGWREFRTKGDEEKDLQFFEAMHHQIQKFERRRIKPMRIFDNQKNRLCGCHQFKMVCKCQQRFLFLSLWCQICRQIPITGWYRQECCNQWCHFLHVCG